VVRFCFLAFRLDIVGYANGPSLPSSADAVAFLENILKIMDEWKCSDTAFFQKSAFFSEEKKQKTFMS